MYAEAQNAVMIGSKEEERRNDATGQTFACDANFNSENYNKPSRISGEI
jgi:hypothetical protein